MPPSNAFLKRRTSKLIGVKHTSKHLLSPPQKQRDLDSASTTARHTPEHEYELFKDYCYVTMHRRNGPALEPQMFVCYREDVVFGQNPPHQRQNYDNDEDSKPENIRREIYRGVNSIQECLKSL